MCNHNRVVTKEKGFFSSHQTCQIFALIVSLLLTSGFCKDKFLLWFICIVTFVCRGTNIFNCWLMKERSDSSSWSERRIKKSHHKTGYQQIGWVVSSLCHNGPKLISFIHICILQFPCWCIPSNLPVLLSHVCFLLLLSSFLISNFIICLVILLNFSSMTQKTPMTREWKEVSLPRGIYNHKPLLMSEHHTHIITSSQLLMNNVLLLHST